jgi:hypothetical protein
LDVFSNITNRAVQAPAVAHRAYDLSAQYRLVGLQCVALGQGNSGAIAVTWSKPKTPELARQVADQGRIFACGSALVFGADVFDSFLREFAAEEWLDFAHDTRAIATKAKTRLGGAEYSVAERAEALCAELGISDPVRIAALDLLAKWRNVVAHSSDRRPRLMKEGKGILLGAASEIEKRYSNFDIALALKNFENRKIPVPKETTSLVAVATNFSRQIDEAAIKRSASTSDKVAAAVEIMLRTYFRASDERAVTPWREVSNAWQGGFAQR